jgi:CBS-domain-containing membrane protein
MTADTTQFCEERRLRDYFAKMRGGEKRPPQRCSWKEVGCIFALSFIGIYAVYWANRLVGIAESGNIYLIGSFGATAVLVYGAPQSEFSQPRNLVGGHLLSAFIGVLMYKLLPNDVALSGALAVSLSIATMFLTKTVHPPGGATALIAIVNVRTHDLGFYYLLAPVLVGTLITLAAALLMNNLFSSPNRRYPRYWY